MGAIANTINGLNKVAGLSITDIANITHSNRSSPSRWKNGKATPNPDVQLILSDLKYTADCLSEFYAPDEVRVWLFSRNRLLDGEVAVDLIRKSQTEVVLRAIERLGSHSYM